MRLLSWNKKRSGFVLDNFAKHSSFLTIDPGSKGGWVLWLENEPVEAGFFHEFAGYVDMEMAVAREKISFVILEGAYIGDSAAAALKLGFWRGFAAATLRRACHPATRSKLTVMQVMAISWQSKLPRVQPEGHPWDKDAKTLATNYIFDHHTRLGKPLSRWAIHPASQKEGIASALGMGDWWNIVREGIV